MHLYLESLEGAEYFALERDLERRIEAHKRECKKCSSGPLDAFT